MSEKRIYLAAPYTHVLFSVRHERFMGVSRKAAELMKQGYVVFSPITHSYYLAECCGCPNEPGFWQQWYMTFLEHWATDLYVLMFPGWKASCGVATEIEYAKTHGLPIEYLTV